MASTDSPYLSGQINFTGLGSGSDFNSVTDKLVEIESTHKKQMESWKADWEAKVEALQSLNTKMLSLKTTLEGMDTLSEFLVKKTTSTNTDVLTASADATAESGTHSVSVRQLAQNAVMTNNTGFSAKTAVVVSGAGQSFSYVYKGTTRSVTAPAGTTLETLTTLVNNDPGNLGVRAALLYDGTKYYMQMRGLDLGSNATLSFAGGLSNPAFDAAGDFTTTQINQNAKIKVDGWPLASNAWVETHSNSVTGVLQGVTMNLLSAGASPPSTLSITIDVDKDKIKANIQTFISQVNEVRKLFAEMQKFDSQQKKGSILTGNYGVQLVASDLRQVVAQGGKGFKGYNPGPPPSGDPFSVLAQLGVTTDADEGSPTVGLLILDEELLDDALASKPDAAAQLFAADYLGTQDVSSGNFSYYTRVSGMTKPGTYSVSYASTGAAPTNAFIDGQAASISLQDGVYYLTATSGDAKGISVRVNDPTKAGSGLVRLKLGKAGELASLLKDVTNANTGSLSIISNNYDDIIDNIDKKIEYEQKRLDRYARTLRNRFARLEALLSTYNQQQSSMQGQIAQMTKS